MWKLKHITKKPNLEIDLQSFKCKEELGSGNFGIVHKGTATGLDSKYPDSETEVAIKTPKLSLFQDRTQCVTLLEEIQILSSLERHLNLVNMIGSCTSYLQSKGKVWLLLEFCEHGNMKDFLRNHELDLSDKHAVSYEESGQLNSRLLLHWIFDIVHGMKYLSKENIKHGDLSARNILIAEQELNGSTKLYAKVSDFGLSKSFYGNITYRRQKRLKVPWKWTAPEGLNANEFTIVSDVWSFGVLVWEIFSMGREPYAGLTSEEVVAKLSCGYTLPFPGQLNHVTTWSPVDVYNTIFALLCL